MPTDAAADPVTIHLHPSDRAALDELAGATATDPAALATRAVVAYLDTHRAQTETIRRRMADGTHTLATDAEVDAAFAAFG